MPYRIETRLATTEDTPHIRAIQRAALNQVAPAWNGVDPTSCWKAGPGHDLATMIAERHYVVATINGRIVGGAGWQAGNRPDTAILREVFVHPAHQGRGIGTRLVVLVEDLAVTGGYDTVTTAAPAHVVSFYRTMGYANAASGAVALGQRVDVQYREMRKAAF